MVVRKYTEIHRSHLVKMLQKLYYLEDCNCGPEQGIEILPVTDPSLRVNELAPEQIHPQNTEIFQRFKGILPRTES